MELSVPPGTMLTALFVSLVWGFIIPLNGCNTTYDRHTHVCADALKLYRLSTWPRFAALS